MILTIGSPCAGTGPREVQDITDTASRPQRRSRGPFTPFGAVLGFALVTGAMIGCVQGEAKRRGEDGARNTGAPAERSAEGVVRLDSAAQRLAGIEIDTVSSGGDGALIANGTITYDANRVSVVGSRAEERVVSVRTDLGARVRAGAVLAMIESSEVGELRGQLERAQALREVARRTYEREQRLYAAEISSQKELLAAETEHRTAEAEYRSALARLEAVGASTGDGATFSLRTSVSGTVVERNASPGQLVGPETNLFTVADLYHVWITVDVYESDFERVRRGAPAVVLPRALPDEKFAGRVTVAGSVVDTVTRTFKVRVEVENTEGRLRPGMFALVRIDAPGRSGAQEPPTVPELAVQELDGKQVVFVPGTEPGEFVAHPVTLGPRTGSGRVVIAQGVSIGEPIVARGAFQLKAELTKASFGKDND